MVLLIDRIYKLKPLGSICKSFIIKCQVECNEPRAGPWRMAKICALCTFQRGPTSPGIVKKWSKEPNSGWQMFLEPSPILLPLWNRPLSSGTQALRLWWFPCDALECQVRKLSYLGGRWPFLGCSGIDLPWARGPGPEGWYPVDLHFHFCYVGFHAFPSPLGIFIWS